MLLAEKQKTDPGAKEIWSYEQSYLSELVRRTQYDFDSQSVRPYFPFMRGEARHPRYRRRALPRHLPAGAERPLLGSLGRNLDRHR